MNPVAGGPTPAGVSRAGAFYPAIALLHAISLGAVLPQVFFVNDLGHPFQTGLLLSLFPAGRLVGKCVFRQGSADYLDRGPMVLQGVGLTLTFLLMVVSAELHPTGIEALRLAQLAWFLVGLFGVNLLFRRSSPARAIDISTLGISIGAFLCSVLTWRLVRSSLRYDMTELAGPALVAAGCAGLAVILLLAGWRGGRRETPKLLREVLITGGPDLRKAIGVSAGAAGAVAIACTLTPMMLWETFAFSASGVARMIASGGLLAVSVNIIIRRVLSQSRSNNVVAGLAAVGLFLLGTSAAALMWAPSTAFGFLVFVGCVALSVGWGCLQPTMSSLIAMSCERFSTGAAMAANDVACTLAWIVAPILSASIFYAHERSSFALSGVAAVLAAVQLAAIWRKQV